MSEQILEELREYHRMRARVEEIIGFLDNCEWKKFTIYDARKCVEYIKNGEGWI